MIGCFVQNYNGIEPQQSAIAYPTRLCSIVLYNILVYTSHQRYVKRVLSEAIYNQEILMFALSLRKHREMSPPDTWALFNVGYSVFFILNKGVFCLKIWSANSQISYIKWGPDLRRARSPITSFKHARKLPIDITIKVKVI